MQDPFDLSQYAYELPKGLIAQKPMEPRDHSRLMLINRQDQTIHHYRFDDIHSLLPKDSLLVANNSKVIPARLKGHRIDEQNGKKQIGGKVECLLLEASKEDPCVWEALIHCSAKKRVGLQVELTNASETESIFGEVIRSSVESEEGTVWIRFNQNPMESNVGQVPLPPYIHRHDFPKKQDENAYQTVYAKHDGSVAAPTAGLHFTPRVLKRLKEEGMGWEEITLHVGLGTFRPVHAQDIRKHSMHEETYSISRQTAHALNENVEQKKPLIAVGTTAVRVLESAWDGKAFSGGSSKTSLFLYPGGPSVQVVNGLLTNFHLPYSTLLMLVCAFGGYELVMKAYNEAVRNKYRFYSYGDAMLIL